MPSLAEIYRDQKGLSYNERCEKMSLANVDNFVCSLFKDKDLIAITNLIETIQGKIFTSLYDKDLIKDMRFGMRNLLLDAQKDIHELTRNTEFSWSDSSLIQHFTKYDWLKKTDQGLYYLAGDGKTKEDRSKFYQFIFKDKVVEILRVLAIYESRLLEFNEQIFKNWFEMSKKQGQHSAFLPMFYQTMKVKMISKLQANRSLLIVLV